MADLPPASVVVAAYNCEAVMARCIDHLLALDYPDYEILVVDNASADGTRAIAERYAADRETPRRVVLLDETRTGWPAARNRAWHHAKAPLVANIDSDCFAEPAWLRELVAALLADPGAGCAVGRTQVEPGTTLAQRFYAASDPFNIEKYVYQTARSKGRQCPWGGGNNVVRREVIEAVGGYDAVTYTSGADREFHQRFEAATGLRTIYAPEAVIWHMARGSAREFFSVSAKYAADAVVNARLDPAMADYADRQVRRNLGLVLRHTAGLLVRGARFLIGRESALRVAQPVFWNVQCLGSIWGHWRGKRRVAAARGNRS